MISLQTLGAITKLSQLCDITLITGTYILKGHASLPKSPLIGGLFTCHKNPSAPSALSRPLGALGFLWHVNKPPIRGFFLLNLHVPLKYRSLLIIKWYHLVQLVISLSSKVIYHILLNDLEFPLLLLVSDWPRRHLLECTSEWIDR